MQPRTRLVAELERRLERGRTGRERTAKPRTGEGPRTAYGRTTRAGGEPDAGHETARTVRRRAAGPQRARGLGRGQPVRITPGPQDQGRPAQRDQTAHGQAHRPAGGRTAADRPMERATAPRGADTAARTAFRRSAHDVRGCERQTRRNGIPRPPRCRRSGHARPSRRTAQWS